MEWVTKFLTKISRVSEKGEDPYSEKGTQKNIGDDNPRKTQFAKCFGALNFEDNDCYTVLQMNGKKLKRK